MPSSTPTAYCVHDFTQETGAKEDKKSHMEAIKLQNTAPQTNYATMPTVTIHTVLGLKAKKLQL